MSDDRERFRLAMLAMGKWLSAALDDPDVCDAMKADIVEWFEATARLTDITTLSDHEPQGRV
jgi:hypothetical protein